MTSRYDYWASDSIYDEILEKARDYYESGNYFDALKMYNELVMTAGIDADIYHEAACCYYKLSEFTSAVAYFEKSLQLNDRRWNGFSLLAECYYNLKQYNNAIYNSLRARALKPESLQETLNLSKYYSENNMKFESFYYLNKAFQALTDKRNDEYKRISGILSSARYNAEKFATSAYRAFSHKELISANNSYKQALAEYPINYDYNYNLAIINRDMKNSKESIFYFLRALFLNPRETRIYMHIAAEYSKLRDYTRAYCFVKRYINTLIANPNQSEYLSAMKNLKMLEPHINQSFSIDVSELLATNKYLEALYELENSLLITNNEKNKIEFEKLEMLIFPEQSLSKLYNSKGTDLYTQGKFKEANKFFTRVMEISSKDSAEYKFAKDRIR